MKFFLILSFLAANCAANPIIVFEGARKVQMCHENVVLRVGPHSTKVSGDYTFAQLAASFSKKEDEFVLVWVPVFVADGGEVKLAQIVPAYSPKIEVNGVTYAPVDALPGGLAWSSFWDCAKFYFAAFQFIVPRRGLGESFQIHIEYIQPHMNGRGVEYACYCPLRPEFENPLYRKIDDDQFTLRAVPLDGVRLKRVSKNLKVIEETSESIALHCIHLERIILRIKRPKRAQERRSSAVLDRARACLQNQFVTKIEARGR